MQGPTSRDGDLMATHWVFALLSLAFAIAATWRALRLRRADPAVRTWAWVALVFGAVSAWLTFRQG